MLLAGRAWLEFGPHRAQGRVGEELTSRVPTLLTRLMQHIDLPPKQRLEAGTLAADLGDLPEDLDDWVEIPADTLDYPFKIGKYPVTNAQFRRFVEEGGYDRKKGWFSEEAQRKILIFEKMVTEGKWPEGPRYEDSPRLNRQTVPVVGISWYEATAYAAWLTRELRSKASIGEEEIVRLATVAEWERACGGTEGRTYSWDGEFDARKANTEDSGLNRPTPVHMYPAGATPGGIMDLTGNVWEWTADKASQTSYKLVGGAYYCDKDQAGAAARFGRVALRRPDYIGFRVVVVPISRSNPDS